MSSQRSLESLLGSARFAPYMSQAAGDSDRAADLYLWATQLSGALHAQISFVEIAVRNALDAHLGRWHVEQGYDQAWTAACGTSEPVYSLLRRPLAEARSRAFREAAERDRGHPRHGAEVTHDDVVSQLMFGSWVTLIRPISVAESPARQQRLWADALAEAFPGAANGDDGRKSVANQVDVLRRLRNRVAHHDNLLRVQVAHRLNGMLSLLSKIDESFPGLATGKSTIRRLVREDPRRLWP